MQVAEDGMDNVFKASASAVRVRARPLPHTVCRTQIGLGRWHRLVVFGVFHMSAGGDNT